MTLRQIADFIYCHQSQRGAPPPFIELSDVEAAELRDDLAAHGCPAVDAALLQVMGVRVRIVTDA